MFLTVFLDRFLLRSSSRTSQCDSTITLLCAPQHWLTQYQDHQIASQRYDLELVHACDFLLPLTYPETLWLSMWRRTTWLSSVRQASERISSSRSLDLSMRSSLVKSQHGSESRMHGNVWKCINIYIFHIKMIVIYIWKYIHINHLCE